MARQEFRKGKIQKTTKHGSIHVQVVRLQGKKIAIKTPVASR